MYVQPGSDKEWGFHNARVNCVAWSPDSLLVASGSLDTNIIIWSVEKPAKHIIIKSKFKNLLKSLSYQKQLYIKLKKKLLKL